MSRTGSVELAGADQSLGAFLLPTLDALPAAICVADPEGIITYYNAAAAELWGRAPAIGEVRWCGSLRLFTPDGSILPHDQSPMALALSGQLVGAGVEAVVERPDGVRVPFIAYPRLLHDTSGTVTGAVNLLVEIAERKRDEEHAQRLAAIVASSQDAIVSRDLRGIITSWNKGAERLYGYTAEEVVGRSIAIIIPPELSGEEPALLERIHRGEGIDHFETTRRRKDGSLVEISLTVSPIRNSAGRIIGVSKIARDITEKRKAEERQQLLVREMAHRVKNLFAMCGGVVSLSARYATDAAELASAIRERLAALSRANALTLPSVSGEELTAARPTTLHTLIRTILLPYENGGDGKRPRVAIDGPDIGVDPGVTTSLALLMHEFATNAMKYGALSTPEGTVGIACMDEGEHYCLVWTERGGPHVEHERSEGFGTYLGRATVNWQLGGDIEREWAPEGVIIRLRVPRSRLEAQA